MRLGVPYVTSLFYAVAVGQYYIEDIDTQY
jgi:hypothetical protein